MQHLQVPQAPLQLPQAPHPQHLGMDQLFRVAQVLRLRALQEELPPARPTLRALLVRPLQVVPALQLRLPVEAALVELWLSPRRLLQRALCRPPLLLFPPQAGQVGPVLLHQLKIQQLL